MESVLVALFFVSAGLIIYTWICFPIILVAARKIFPAVKRPPDVIREYPHISVIVAAFNEEAVIAKKIENLLKQDYPEERIEIIIGSDGSTDKTVEIAARYKNQGIKLINFLKNRGKASVHNDLIGEAGGEILLFTDAETIFEKDFIKKSIRWFNDSRYGAGAGDYTFSYKDDIGKTENMYWKMEKQMRYWEFILGILPFASGGCFFLKKELYERITPHGDIDNLLTLSTVKNGYKIFYARDARAYDSAIQGARSHYKKRVRTSLRSIGDMFSYLPELFRAKKWVTIWILFSHRIFRWFSGYLMVLMFLSNVVLILTHYGLLFTVILWLQIVYYCFVIAGWYNEHSDRKIVLSFFSKIAYSFFLANLGSTLAIFKLCRNVKITTWKNQ